MSSNPFADLAESLSAFTEAADDATSTAPFTPESQAARECQPESLADAWGDHPARDAWIATRQRSDAGLDHLRALAELLPSQRVIFALSTVARGSVEAFAQAFYLGAPDIDIKERVRRAANARLASGHEVGNLIRGSVEGRDNPVEKQGAQETLEKHQERQAGIVESARRQRFTVREERDTRRATYLAPKPPSIISLCAEVVAETSGLGHTYYRLLSAVAHSTGYGFSQHIEILSPLEDRSTGDASGLVALTGNSAALRLLAAPLAAVTVVSEVYPLCGWTVPSDEIKRMLTVWGRIAQVRYPLD